MVSVNYNCYSLRRITKITSEDIFVKNGKTLMEILGELIAKYGELFRNQLFDIDTGNLKLIILVNGRAANNLCNDIKASDKINIVSSLRGG
jgi:molybdopterin converting factor small subunit